VGDVGAINFAEALQLNTTLTSLNLAGTERGREEGKGKLSAHGIDGVSKKKHVDGEAAGVEV